MTAYSTLKRGRPLKRSAGPQRKKALNFRSKRARAKDEARVACREEVLSRDENCVFHQIVGQLGGRSICDGWGGRLEVHEIQTRARGGSETDPGNCVAICNWANTIWLTTHDAGGETLGLLLPGWAREDMRDWAWNRRDALLSGHEALTIPPWRQDMPNYIGQVIRDLGTLGIG